MLIKKDTSYIFIGIVLTLVVLPTNVFSRPKYPWYLTDALQEPVCRQEQCKVRSKLISSFLEESFDPCTNFYRYVCGGWQKLNPVPPSQTIWNIETLFDHNFFMQMRYHLQKPVTSKDSLTMKRAKQYFRTCSILPSLNKSTVEEIRAKIKEAGRWPMVTNKNKKGTSSTWAETHYYYFKLSADAGLFDVDINVDPQDYYKPLLELKALHSPFGLIQKDVLWKSDWLKHYYHFLVKLVEYVVTDIPVQITEKSLTHSIKEIFHFRKKLEEAVTDEVLDTNAYHPLTIREFQHWFDSHFVTQDNKKLVWIRTLNSLFLKSTEGLMTVATRINVKHKKYFETLATILSETSAEVIVNHLHLYFVERYVLLDTHLIAMAQKLVTVGGANVGTIRPLDVRWEKCISKSSIGNEIDKIYVSQFLTDNTRRDVMKIYYAVKDIVKMHINDSTWLDSESKTKGLLRLDDVKVTIGFPHTSNIKMYNKYKNTVDPRSVHAFYSVDTNQIFISGSYLQSPMYTENLPYVLNYASIGSLLAHELYHVFDRTGVSYPIYPKETCKTLWTPKIFHIYEEKAKCIVNLYNRPVKGLLNIPHAPRSDGKRTYNENFADIMSIRTSYDAFKKRMIEEDRTCTVLPDLKHINCEKLFFISYAMTFCSNAAEWKILRKVQNNIHSVAELRVNMPVANMPEFSQAFECSKRSYENSVKRCYIWD